MNKSEWDVSHTRAYRPAAAAAAPHCTAMCGQTSVMKDTGCSWNSGQADDDQKGPTGVDVVIFQNKTNDMMLSTFSFTTTNFSFFF